MSHFQYTNVVSNLLKDNTNTTTENIGISNDSLPRTITPQP